MPTGNCSLVAKGNHVKNFMLKKQLLIIPSKLEIRGTAGNARKSKGLKRMKYKMFFCRLNYHVTITFRH